jgi:prepilin-type N-terminal cleavage/methylation domain-containing protein/prepilin-type processing-associated H-X9-DG protein
MRGKGFTLVELLVVIAIITVLMGILIPISHTAREQTRAAVCGSNLKQVSLALTLYAQNNETFPYGFDNSEFGIVIPPGGYPGDASCDLLGWWWFHSLSDIGGQNYGKGTILWCPSRNVSEPYCLCGNYGVNRAICKDAIGFWDNEFVGAPLALYQIRRPAETLLITDSGYSLISWKGATNAPIEPFENMAREGSFYVPGLRINQNRFIFHGQKGDAIYGRHLNKRINVGFVDGHVSRLKADELLVEEIDGEYRNQFPLWLPK